MGIVHVQRDLYFSNSLYISSVPLPVFTLFLICAVSFHQHYRDVILKEIAYFFSHSCRYQFLSHRQKYCGVKILSVVVSASDILYFINSEVQYLMSFHDATTP